MKARPILFSGPMIMALLAGRKTQTRRIVKPQPSPLAAFFKRDVYAMFGWTDNQWLACPYGQPGDLLWVREAWRTGEAWDRDAPRAIHPGSSVSYEVDQPTMSGRYRHARFMPRWASRLTLELTDVRVQRVQGITEADARAEGVEPVAIKITGCQPGVAGGGAITAREQFAQLWDSINGWPTSSWNRNDWVWALTFRVIHANVDTVLRQRAAA